MASSRWLSTTSPIEGEDRFFLMNFAIAPDVSQAEQRQQRQRMARLAPKSLVARYWLAIMLHTGYGSSDDGGMRDTQHDSTQARLMLESAATKVPDAAAALASFMYHGIGGKVDYKGARAYAMIAAEAGLPTAQTLLGTLLLRGLGGDEDVAEAERVLRQAVAQGFLLANTTLGHALAEQRNYSEAVELLEPVAESGDLDAQHRVGVMYASLKEYAKARRWLSQALQQTDDLLRQQLEQGSSHDTGSAAGASLQQQMEQVAQQEELEDMDDGMSEEELAALVERRSLIAHSLGLLLVRGQGGPKQPEDAVRLLAIAAKQGHGDAIFNLATSFVRGDDLPQDLAQARRLFELLADAGDAEAQFEYAKMLIRGDGGPVDLAQAHEYLELAAPTIADAQTLLRSHLFAQLAKHREQHDSSTDSQ